MKMIEHIKVEGDREELERLWTWLDAEGMGAELLETWAEGEE